MGQPASSHSAQKHCLGSARAALLTYTDGDGHPHPSEAAVFPTFRTLYGVAPDDQRFLIARFYQAEEGAGSALILVQNGFEELKRRVPN